MFDYNTTMRILKYINGALSFGLFFSYNIFVYLKAFCDSDWSIM